MRIAAHHRRIVTALAALALLAVPVARAASAASYITVTISGTVRDGTTGTGVGGMCVYGTEEGYEGSTGPFVTAADGTYTWTSRAVQGAHFSYVLFAQPGCGASNWQTAYHSPPIELTAEPGQSAATGVDITTYRSGRIHGRITDLRTGKPLALALVFAVPVAKGPQAVDGETDAAGRFALDGVAAGTEKLIVDNVPGYLDGWAYREPTEPLATPYTVNVGQDVTVNDSPPRANTITGRVTDAVTGLPVARITVTYRQTSGSWVGLRHPVTTGADGIYHLTDVGVGSFVVCFEDRRAVPLYAGRCYKNRPLSGYGWTPVNTFGFGSVFPGINQSLPPAPGQAVG